MADLKLRSVTLRLARVRLARMMWAIEMIKAVGASGGVAGRVIWRDLPLLWAAIIMAAQLPEALRHALPFARQHAAAGKLGRCWSFCSLMQSTSGSGFSLTK